MGIFSNFKRGVAAAVVGAAISAASAASALTINFSQYLTGDDLGNVTLATLDAVQNGNNVDMTFTNTGIVGGSATFDTALQMMYNGSTSGISFQHTGGVAATFGGNSVGPFNPWDLVVNWSPSNKNNGANRLNVGEWSSFSLIGAQLSNLFFGSGSNPNAMIHVQGLASGGSTKYGPGTPPPAPVPVPAAGLMLLAGLGAAGVVTRRRRKAA